MTTSDLVGVLTSESPELPPALYGYAGMHRAMRRDAARLVALLADEANPARVAEWWGHYSAVIVRHHEREDELVWPAISSVDPSFGADIEPMHEDHALLDEVMARVGGALGARRTGAVGQAQHVAAEFRDVLDGHLDREERVAFHRLAAHPQMWARVERRIERAMRPREAAFEIPWLHDGFDEVRSAYLRRRVPLVVRPVLDHVWTPRYRRLVAAVSS
jgi:hypothetical protein